MTDIVMPRLSDTMEEGTILRWLKHDGEHVRRGEELAEIETDKASMTYESDSDGTLETVAREGDTLTVGELIARIGEQGEAPAPAVARIGGEDERPAPATAVSSEQSQPGEAGVPSASARPVSDRVKASPIARRIARETGVELGALTGSGPGGRIVKADVQAAQAQPRPAADGIAAHTQPASGPIDVQAPAEPRAERAPEPPGGPAPSSPPQVKDIAAAKGETTIVEPSRTQRTIARRMAESKATIPDFTLRVEVDMELCAQLRAELKRLSPQEVPTYNDMVVKACALALREHPRANGSYRDGRFELHSRVNVGVAVAVDAEDPMHSALVVPTLLDADGKSLGEIARETRMLAQKVRDGSITPPELSGATFTVSNLGMYGIADFTAIVNPPQAAILAVGAVARRAIVRPDGAADSAHDAGEIAIRHTMGMTLSCDHRILYGADAALFLARIRELLEEPAALTL
jgi:pyruvate dehydrogenase E2 component (dihydrolipoamide acetyltransferase)